MRNRMLVLVSFALFILVVTFFIVQWLSRVGEVGINISSLPSVAKITLNGKSIDAGVVFLRPGEYTIKASLDGWEDDTRVIEVGSGISKVVLLPDPNSEEANTYLEDNLDVQLAREKAGGVRAAELSAKQEQESPIINKLPYTDADGPFSIDYGPSGAASNKGGIFLLISDSSPNGRINALKWIRQQGYDPTDYEIQYADFINPLGERRSGGVYEDQ